MRQLSTNKLNLITAGVLSLLAQGLLLLPAQMDALTGHLPGRGIQVIAATLFVLAIGSQLSITTSLPAHVQKGIHFANLLALGKLLHSYIQGQMLIEAMLMGGLAIGHLLALFVSRHNKYDITLGILAAINAGAGLAILPSIYDAKQGIHLIVGGVFVATSILGGYTVATPRKSFGRVINKLLALPWLAWGAIHLPEGLLPTLLPAFVLTAILSSLDHIPWKYVTLSQDDRFGRRILMIAWTTQIFTLFGLTLLLDDTTSHSRDGWFLLNLMIIALSTFSAAVTIITINGISSSTLEITDRPQSVREGIARYFGSFVPTATDLQVYANVQAEQIESIKQQLNNEKHRTAQLILLNELSQQLETQLDQPVAAQLAANTLERAVGCSLVALFMNEPETKELVVLASAGSKTSLIPPDYRQDSNTGLVGRAVRLRKTQVVSDTRLDSDFFPLQKEETLSELVIPIVQHGYVKGVLDICSDRVNAFTSADVTIAEAVASELMRAWARTSYHEHLTELIQAGISLTTVLDPEAAVQEIAMIARKTLEARFVFVTLPDQTGNFSRTAWAGKAPKLLESLTQNVIAEPLMKAALNAAQPFRIRDVRKYSKSSRIEVDNPNLRSFLAIPIRLHRLSIGAILAFGKQREVFFSENDESLADLLSSQASAAIESSWLSQELRNSLKTASLLHRLSVDILQTEELSQVAELIVQAAHEVMSAADAGFVLFTNDGQIKAEVGLDTNGFHSRREHPMDIIARAMQTRKYVRESDGERALICFPFLTSTQSDGALWINVPERPRRNEQNLRTLANQAFVIFERIILLFEWRAQAKQIKAAYKELEITYDQTLAALMSALDARDRETEGHSARVGQLTMQLGAALGLGEKQIKALERGSLLHDIGKIGISDTILHKPSKLTEDEWKIMRLHPDIGARIVEGIPFLQETLPVIRYHHERWDGSGYPLGLTKGDIPIQARIFAVADAYDALTSTRPYRKKSSREEALQYLSKQAGVLFDPLVVETLERLSRERRFEDQAVST